MIVPPRLFFSRRPEGPRRERGPVPARPCGPAAERACRAGRARRRGYTLVELFLTVAVLMMVLGLAVNLSARLRDDALQRRTRGQLQQLTAAVARYAADHDGRLPEVTPLVDPAAAVVAPADVTPTGDPPAVTERARQNRADVRRALGLGEPAPGGPDPLTDPWGSPIVLLPRQNPAIGMAPGDRFFFVSAGPDRRFLTRADNLYSYDYVDANGGSTTTATTDPAAGTATRPGWAGER
jgi:type II secretory pathway pseudopilin PulG